MIDNSLSETLRQWITHDFEPAKVSRLLAVLSEAEEIMDNIDPHAVRIDQLIADYREWVGNVNMSPKTRYSRVFRLRVLLSAAINEGLLVEEPNTDDFPSLSPPTDPVELRLYKNFNRFKKYCLSNKYAFLDINEDVVISYLEHLKLTLAVSTAEVAYNDLLAWWRKKEYHQVLFPPFTGRGKNHYGLQPGIWPDDWQVSFRAFRKSADSGMTVPPFGRWEASLCEGTIGDYQKLLGYFAGYLQHIGKLPISDSLPAVLAQPENAINFIEWHVTERCGGVERCYHQSWLEKLGRLDKFFSNRGSVQKVYLEAAESLEIQLVRGMIDTNEMSLGRLYHAAEDAAEEAIRTWRKSTGNLTAALRYRTLLMFGLLIYRPLRASNITGLRVGNGLVKNCAGNGSSYTIRVDAADFKGRRQWRGAWPDALLGALQVYLDEVRAVITGPEESLVFPSKSSRRLSGTDIYDIIVKISEEKLGKPFTPHQFRALVGTLYLLEHPEEMTTIQHLLGHRFVTTTMKYYVHVTARQASKRVGEYVYLRCEAAQRVSEWVPSEELRSVLS